MKPLKLWAIIDTQKKEYRFCYADEKKTNGAMALYDKKPTIKKGWENKKKVIKVSVSSAEKQPRIDPMIKNKKLWDSLLRITPTDLGGSTKSARKVYDWIQRYYK